MKAMGITRIGGPEVLQRVEVDVPDRSSRMLALVRTEATAYNHVDAIMCKEDLGLEFPHVPGSDVVGRLVGGPLAEARVVVNPGIPCESCDGCLKGQFCRYVRVLGVHSFGGYGEYVAVPVRQCFAIPEHIPLEEAAAFPLAFLTAWRMLSTRANVAPGQTVLIWGATGSSGSAAIAVTKILGGRAIAITRRPDCEERLLRYGAERVINVADNDLEIEVAKATHGRGAEIVFEGPGSATWERSMKVVSQGGIIVTAGVTTGSNVSLDIEELYYRQISVIGSRMGYVHEFEAALGEFIARRVSPLISKVTGLSEARRVHRVAASGERCGKIVMVYDL